MPSAIDRARFSRFVERALATARARGLRSAEIQQVTGIQLSTIHRWRRGEIAPTVDKVRKFCAGLDLDPTEALAALGVGGRREPTPEPPMDPDVALLLRKLASPNTNEATKDYIRQTLRVLANLPDQPPRRRKAG